MDKVRRKQQQQQQAQLPAIGDEDEEEHEEEEKVSRSPMVTASKTKKTSTASTSASSSHKPYFGIKSYLHKFYENACTASDLEDYEEDSSCSLQGTQRDDQEVISSKNQEGGGCGCQHRYLLLSLLVGLLALLAGLGLLLVGFAFPRMRIDLGYQEEMRIIDRKAVAFNEHLEQLKFLGLVVFAMGGAVVAAALLLPSLLGGNGGGGGHRGSNMSEDFDSEEHFKVRVVHEDSFMTGSKSKGAEEVEEDDDPEEEATRRLIPVEEQLSAVQPKAEPGGHTVATKKSGLKQIN